MVFNVFGNATDTISWIPNPRTRGTANILESCLITTSLCVWTAVHLNIPAHDDSTFLWLSYQTWRKVKWLIIGLLAPEMLVYTAWYQRSEAKKFVEEYNKTILGLSPSPGFFAKGGKWHQTLRKIFHLEAANIRSHNEEEESEKIKNAEDEKEREAKRRPPRPWTLVQGFYAQMGGFVLDSFDVYPDFLPEIRGTLDLRSFRPLLKYERKPLVEPQEQTNQEMPRQDQQLNQDHGEEGEIKHSHDGEVNQAQHLSMPGILERLDISQEYILDKSNASGLAKAIVCGQALWFCIQCISRISQNFPITLLELNTFAHAICALIVYVLWWHKPLNVEQGTSLPVRDSQGIKIWAWFNQGKYFQSPGQRPRDTNPWFHTSYTNYPKANVSLRHDTKGPSKVPSELWNVVEDFEYSDGTTTCQGYLVRDPWRRSGGFWWPRPNQRFPGHSIELRIMGAHLGRGGWYTEEVYNSLGPDRLSRRAKNWPSFDIKRPWVQVLFLLVAFLYGGLHCLAWNLKFPSHIQQLLWRISSLTIMAAGFPALLLYSLWKFVDISNSEYRPRIGHTPSMPRWLKYMFKVSKLFFKEKEPMVWTGPTHLTHFIDLMLRGTMIFLLCGYVFARTYLIIECFIQLFHLPPGLDFVQPSWSTYFPHIG